MEKTDVKTLNDLDRKIVALNTGRIGSIVAIEEDCVRIRFDGYSGSVTVSFESFFRLLASSPNARKLVNEAKEQMKKGRG